MPTSRDYLPRTDSGFLNWAANLNSQLVAQGASSPTGDAWGVSAQQIADYTAAYQAYEAAYTAANENSTRTPSSIQTKNDARDALKALSRDYVVDILQVNPAMTNTIRRDLQITVRDTEPTPVDKPDTAPIVYVDKVWGRDVTILLRDSLNSESRARPEGVLGANIIYHVGETEPTTAEQWLPGGNATRTTHTITFPDSAQPGDKVWISALWYNTKGQTGPAATPVSTGIGYEGTSVAA